MRVVFALMTCWLVVSTAPAHARSTKRAHRRAAPVEPTAPPGTRVAVQPINGNIGPSLRGQVSRLLGHKGFRVLTSVPPASGTSQYPGLAKEHRLAAFVVTDVTERGHSAMVTFLVWRGSDGGVAGRWSVAASDKKLWRAVAKGFWQHLGQALAESQAPPSDELGEAPPLHIDAGDPSDESVVSDDGFRQTAPILH